MISSLIELTLWLAVFTGSGRTEINGFSRAQYLSYALWAAFVGRMNSSWMYEFRMVNEVESGSVNSVIVRPTSFYEYYLSQFMGYKIVTASFSLIIPLVVSSFIPGAVMLSRVPAAILLCLYYLILVHTMSFVVACSSMFLTRVSSITVAKNLMLWIISGELFPLDLLPQPFRDIAIALPFSSAVYIPVGYLTGRIGNAGLLGGFWSVTLGIMFLGVLAQWLWRLGMRRYAGTGA